MAFSSGNDSGGPMAEINVTPLVDVMLVLLIIFMITAPLMSHKVKVELPEADVANLEQLAPEVPPITLAVTQDGKLFWNDEPITASLLESRLSVEAQKTPQPQVNVRGDKTTKYRVIKDVVQVAQQQGMRKVGFVAIPAVLAYNFFTRMNRVTNSKFDTFAHDLHDFFATGSRVGELAAKR